MPSLELLPQHSVFPQQLLCWSAHTLQKGLLRNVCRASYALRASCSWQSRRASARKGRQLSANPMPRRDLQAPAIYGMKEQQQHCMHHRSLMARALPCYKPSPDPLQRCMIHVVHNALSSFI